MNEFIGIRFGRRDGYSKCTICDGYEKPTGVVQFYAKQTGAFICIQCAIREATTQALKTAGQGGQDEDAIRRLH